MYRFDKIFIIPMENSKVKMALKESYIQQKWPDSTGTLALNYDHQTGSELSWKSKIDLENTAPGDNPLFSFLVLYTWPLKQFFTLFWFDF